MDQTPSQLPDAGQLIDALRLAITDHSQRATEVLAQNAQLRDAVEEFLRLVPGSASPTPRQPMRTVVDNSDSTEIKTNAINDVDDPSINESCCSTSTVASPSLRSFPKWLAPPPMVSPTPMNGRNKSALVVEYRKSLSRMFTRFLKDDHYLVRTAYESEDALRLYRDYAPFEVVLIAYGMPTKNGVDIALDILRHDPTQPIIIIASDYRSEDEVPRRKELMDVPFLLDMNNSDYSRFKEILEKLQPWATREEVDRAITALTTDELLKLRKYAEWRVCLSRGTDHRTGKDLLQEALCLTFQGAEGGGAGKRWNKRVTFFTYLIGAIRNVTRRRKSDIDLWCDIFEYDAEGHEHCLLDTIESRDPAAEQLLIAEETVRGFLERFKDDPKARLLLQGWSEGMKRKEIMQEGLSENEYRATVKRIRMKLLGPNGGGGGEKHDRQD